MKAAQIYIGIGRRVWLAAEMLALYVATPVAIYYVLHRYHISLFPVLLTASAILAVALTFQHTFSWRQMLSTRLGWRDGLSILAVFAIAAPVLAAYAWQTNAAKFLYFPNAAFKFWLLVMVLYPLISVTAQEIMYRVFFFQRYRPLFHGDHQAAIVLNAVFFAFGHIIFGSLPSVVISFFGGLLFAWRYDRSRSYWAVVLEHSLYGDLIFTVGLGQHFYTGVANF